jgi:hypothetical protein
MCKRSVLATIEDRVGFGPHKVDKKGLSPEVAAELKSLPKDGSPCRIKLIGFKGMWEPGLVCGYTYDNGSLKALVVFTDRPRPDGLFDYEIVEADRVRHAKPPRPVRDVLTRYH